MLSDYSGGSVTVDELIFEAKAALRGEANKLAIGVSEAALLLSLAFSIGIVNASGVVPQHFDLWSREAGLVTEPTQQTGDVAGRAAG